MTLSGRTHLPLGARGDLTDLRCREAVLAAIEPISGILLAIELFTEAIEATETEEHGCEGGATQCCTGH